MNIYYVYIYRNPVTNSPFYVGYGKNNRYIQHLAEAKRNPIPKSGEHKLNTLRKLLRECKEPIIEIYENNLTKEEACLLEEKLISMFGRIDLKTGSLTNKTKGGDGNREWSSKSKKEMSEKRKGLISAKNLETGEYMKVTSDDPRWVSGELVGQNYKSVNSNCNGKLSGYILAKDTITNETFKVKSNDPRWMSGELVGINKGKPAHDNTKKAASAYHKGRRKSESQKAKMSEHFKMVKWYYNEKEEKIGRFEENTQPEGYIRVSGPHKKTPIV